MWHWLSSQEADQLNYIHSNVVKPHLHHILYLNGCTVYSLTSSCVCLWSSPLLWSSLIPVPVWINQNEVCRFAVALTGYEPLVLLTSQFIQLLCTLLRDSCNDVDMFRKDVKNIWIPYFLVCYFMSSWYPETNTPGYCHHFCIHKSQTISLICWTNLCLSTYLFIPFPLFSVFWKLSENSRWLCLYFKSSFKLCVQ